MQAGVLAETRPTPDSVASPGFGPASTFPLHAHYSFEKNIRTRFSFSSKEIRSSGGSKMLAL